MIDIKTLTATDVAKPVTYRASDEAGLSSGMPERAIICGWDYRRIFIQVHGDKTITTARPSELTWVNP